MDTSQSSCLSPLLYSNDWTTNDDSDEILKLADVTTVVELITTSDESALW